MVRRSCIDHEFAADSGTGGVVPARVYIELRSGTRETVPGDHEAAIDESGNGRPRLRELRRVDQGFRSHGVPGGIVALQIDTASTGVGTVPRDYVSTVVERADRRYR